MIISLIFVFFKGHQCVSAADGSQSAGAEHPAHDDGIGNVVDLL